MKIKAVKNWILCPGLIFLFSIGFGPLSRAQTYTWIGSTGDSWDDPTHWEPQLSNFFADTTLVFNSPETIHAGQVQDQDSNVSLGTIQYDAGALTTTIEIFSSYDGNLLSISGSGIVNHSGTTQILQVDLGSTLIFNNNSTAANVIIDAGPSSIVQFSNNSTAAASQINASGRMSQLQFSGSATAESATLNLSGTLAGVQFSDNSTAGGAFVNASGDGAYVNFSNLTSASNSTITASGNGSNVDFTNGSSGNNSTILLSGNGAGVQFHNTSTAGNASITASGSNTLIEFLGSSTGGNATVNLSNATSQLDISQVELGSITLGSVIGTGTISLGSNNLTIGGNNLNTSFSGSIQDGGINGGSGGSLTKSGTGMLTLSGTNGYSGETTVIGNGGLLISNDVQLGMVPYSPAVNITLNGGLLMNNNSGVILDFYRNISLGVNGGFIDPAYTDAFTINGQISGSGGLTVTWDKGTLILNGNNNYTGATTIGSSAIRHGDLTDANPVLQLGNSHALPGTDLIFGVSGNNNTATLDMNGFNATVAALTGSTNAVVDILSSSGTSALTVGYLDTSSTFQGVLKNTTGTLKLNKIGAGTLTLSGANLFAGATSMVGGTLDLANQNAVQNSTIAISGGSLAFDQSVTGNAFTIGGLSTSFSEVDIALQNNAGSPNAVALSVGNNNANTTYAGSLSGIGSLIKTGTSTLMLTGTSTYSGGTTLNAGTLSVNNSSGLGSGLVMITGSGAGNLSTLQYAPVSSTLSVGAVTLDGYAHLSLETNSAIHSSGAININNLGNLVTLGGITWNSGMNSLLYGTSLTLGNGAAISLTGAIISNQTLTLGGTTTIGRTVYTFGSNSNSLYLQLSQAQFDLVWTGAVNNLWNTLSTDWQSSIQGASLSGTNIAFVTDDNVYFSGSGTSIIVNAGGVQAGNMFVGNTSGTANFSGGNLTVENLTKTGAGELLIYDTLSVTGTFQNSGNGAVTLSGGLTNGSLIQSGSGILTLTATNGYAGSTGVTGGTLNVLGVISQTGSVTVDGNPAAIIVDGAGSSLTTPGGMIVGGTGIGVLNLQNGGGVNAATVTLANSVGSFGTLNIANGAGLFTAGTVTGGSGTAIINFNYGGYSYTFGSQITGNIALNQLCSGITSLTGANSYTGVTTLAAGTLSFANGSLGTAGLVDLTGTSILQWHDTNTQDISARLKIEDGITVFLDTQNNNVTFGSALQTGTAHTGAVIKNGMGILTLAGANSYSGMTGISMGTVNLANQNALQESTVIINGGGLTFDSSAAGHAFTLGGLTGVGNGPGIVLQDNAANAVALSVGNNNANTTYQDALSGSGSLIKIGTGRFTLSGTNSYTGGTTLTGGILSLGSTGALGTTGTISFGGGTLQYTSSNGTDYSSRFSSADHQFYNVDTNGQNVTWASALTSSGGSLNKSGAGILTLTASNSYSGGTSVINGGGLCIGDDSQLGAVPGSPVLNVTLSNGLLMNSGSLLTLNANRIISLGAGGGFIEAANSGVFTVNGPITGVGGLSQSWDSGVLVLNGSNHYGGSTTIGSTVIHSWSDPTANPVLRLGNSNALPGTDLSFGTNSQGNAATLDMNGFNATVGALSGSTNAVVDVSNTGTSVLTVGNLDASGTFQGVLQNTTGTLSLIKIGTGTLIVSGSNNFSGPSAINLGTLILANQNALQHSTASINGGSLVFNSSVSGHAFTFGGLSGVGGLLLEDNALNAVALSVGNNNANTTDAGALTGSGSLIKTGTGTLNLTGANTYTGSTTISLGTLEVSGGGMITQTSGVSVGSNATLAVDGTGSSVTSLGQLAVGSGTGTGTLNLQNGGVVNAGTLGDGTLVLATGTASSGTLNVGGISGGTAGTLNAAQVNSGGGSATINFDQTDSSQFSPQITGNIIVNQIGLGQTILTAANTYTGNTIISSGTLDLANQNAVQNSTVIMNGGNLVFDHSAGGAFTLGGLAAALSGSGYDIALEDNALTPNPVAVSVGNNNVTTIYAGVLSGAGSLIKIGTGTLSLTASNSYSGGTELSSGVLSFANGALGASGTVDFIGNSTLQWNGTNVQDISGRLKIEDGVNATVDTNGNNVTFASTLQTGSAQSGALTKIGAGKLTLTVANQYTGGSNLVAGILSFGNGALGTSGTVDFVGNSTLQWNGSNTQDISGRLKIEDGVVATVDTNGNNVTFASKLQTGSSKTGALTKAGSGVLTLTATNDYLGGTNLNAGTLSFIRGGLGVSGTVDFIGNSTLQWNGTNTQDISGRLKIEDVITATVDTNGNDLRFASALQTGTAQTGALTKAGAGTLWLTATNVYKGATTVTSGTLQVSLGGLITQTGSIMVDGANPADHATFLIDGLIDSGTVTTLGNVTIGNTGFGTLNIEDGGFLQTGSNGGGTVTLASAGGSVGTLNIIGNTSGAGTLNAGIVTGGDGTAVINFQHQDANYVFAPKITGSIALNQTGSGTTILTGSDSYTGATTISSGTLQVSGGGVISKTNAITVDSQVTATNATLSINGTTSSSVTSTGNLTVGNDRIGTLNVTNGGSLTNKESFIGNNAGSNGTLTVDGAGSMWTMSDALNIGYNGTGTVNVSNGGAVTTQVPFAGAGADIYVGYNGGGSGTLNITTSGTVNCFNGYIGYGAGSNGTVTVSGPGSLWNTTAAFSSFNVGINGTGTLNITNGGMVGNYQSTIGNNAGSNGTVNVDGAGSSWQISSITTGLTVGNGGTGTLNITNGGNVTNDVGTIVNHLGTLNVNGAGSTLTHGDTGFPSTLNISGTLNITNGGSVSDSDGYGMGVVNVDGADSTWTNTSTLAVSGTGVVNITHGGKVTNGGGSIDGSSTVNVDGNNSTLSNSGVFTSSGTLNITNGGEVNDLSGSVHGGTTTVSGTGSTWRNSLDFSVDSGTLTIQNGGEVHDLSGSVHGGTTIVSGSGSTWVHDTDFAVESGTLTIQNGGKVTATPLLTNAAYSVSVSSDLLGGNATVNLLTGGTLMVNGPTSGVAVTTLYLGAFLGDHGVLNIGNGGGAGILNVTEVDCDWIAGASGTINFNHNEAAYSFDPSIQGLITVNQKGSGTTLLNNSNSYFGDTTITAGTLELSNSAATGLSTVILNGGSLTFDSSVSGHAFTLISLSATASGIGYDIALHDTSGNPVALTLTGNYFDGNGHWFSLNNNYAGILSGNGSLTMAWSSSYGVLGSQTLSGANTYTGQTTLTTGTLILANQNAVQNSTVTMNGGSLVFDHSVNGHAFTVGGLSATSSGAGYDLELRDSAASAVALSVGNNNSDVSYAGVLSGIGSLNKIGTGTQILSGINTYSGGTIVTSGTLELSGANLSSGTTTLSGGKLKLSNPNAVQNSTVLMNGGDLVFNGSAFTFGGLSASADGPAYWVTLEGSGSNPVVLTVGNNNADTLFASRLIGAGSLIKTGTGTLLFTGGSVYQGATTVNNGTLAVGLGGQISQTSSITVDSITPGTSASLLASGTLLDSTVTSLGNAAIGVSGTGFLKIQDDGLVNLGGISGSGTLTLASGTGSVGTLAIGNGGVAGTLNAAVVTGGSGTGLIQFNHSNVNYVFAPQIAGSTAVNQMGPGTTILTASNTHFGATNLSAGTLNLKNIEALQNSTLVMNGGGLVFDSSVYQHTFTLGGLSGTSSGAGYDIALQDNTGSPVAEVVSVGNNNANTSYAGTLSGSGSIIKIGTGTLTLTGTNQYTGGTTISSGTLQLGNASTVNGSVVGDIIDNAALVFANPSDLTDAGHITGVGSLTKIGAGTLTLSGINHYSGGTNLDAGTLCLGSLGAIGDSGTIRFGGGILQYSGSNTLDYSDRFSAASGQLYNVDTNGQNVAWTTALTSVGGSLTKSGSGTLTLTGSSSYTGATTVAQGTLIVSGSLSAASPVRVGDSVTSGTAVFGGGGIVGDVHIGSTASSGAILCPDAGAFGGSAGTTLTTGALVFSTGASTLSIEIGRTSLGTDVSSHVRVSSIDLTSGGNLQLSLLNTDHTIINGDLFFLILSGSPVTGNFTSLNGSATSLVEGATFTYSGQEYEITYQASNQLSQFSGGQDVALWAVPEPSTWGMLLAGAVVLGFVQRLRRWRLE